MEWYPIKSLCQSNVYFFTFATFNYVDYVFLSCCLNLYLFWILFQGFWRFSFYNYIPYFKSFVLAFGNSPCCVFPECRRGEYFFKRFWGCFWLLMAFVVSSISLILSLFLSSRFFIYFIFLLNPLFISVVGYPLWFRVVCNSLKRVFLRFL